MKKLLAFVKENWKAISAFLLACITLIGALLGATSCGSTTRATIRNFADNTSTTVTITTNNPTEWNVSPDVDLTHTNNGK